MAVEYRRLGKHGTLVSNLCLGTVNFGTWASEKDSFAIMDRALEHGINFFDTADVYGYEFGYGLVEETIEKLLTRRGEVGKKVDSQILVRYEKLAARNSPAVVVVSARSAKETPLSRISLSAFTPPPFEFARPRIWLGSGEWGIHSFMLLSS